MLHAPIILSGFSFSHLLFAFQPKIPKLFSQKQHWNYLGLQINPRDSFFQGDEKVSTVGINGGQTRSQLSLTFTFWHFCAQERLMMTVMYFLQAKCWYFLECQKFNPLFIPFINFFSDFFFNQNLACLSGYMFTKNYIHRNNIDWVMNDLAISSIYFETNYSAKSLRAFISSNCEKIIKIWCAVLKI